MDQLAPRLDSLPGFEAHAWGGGPPATPRHRQIPLVHRDSPLLRFLRWHYRYHSEQLSAVLPTAWMLRRARIRIAFCADPTLALNLKRFQRWHRAQVMFSDGMRLNPAWLQDYDGIHLLAPAYLEEAAKVVRPERLDRFFVVPYFVDTSRFHPPTPAQRLAARAEIGIPPDARVALAVGPVGTESSKRLDHIASELARARHSQWTLLAVGADEPGSATVRKACTEALGDRIRFLGSRSRDWLPRAFHAADLYALGALAEPFSIAILEALASGLPVLHHRFPVTSWITSDAGIAVDMEAAGAAAAALDSLEEDRLLRHRNAALELTAERYAPEVVTAALAGHFQRLQGRPPGHPQSR